VDGTAYLVAETASALNAGGEYQSQFAIYRTAPDLSAWQVLQEDLTGPVYGAFVYREADGERLGLFHSRRVNLWRFGKGGVTSEMKPLPFKWIAETGVQLGDRLYVFGGQFTEDAQGQALCRVAAAVFDGKEFKDLQLAGAEIHPGPNREFWMQAVVHAGQIRVFWRSALTDPALDFEPPVRFPGPVVEAVFTGNGFAPGVRRLTTLPDGQADVWSDGQSLRVVVQAQERVLGQSPPLRLFTIPDSGEPVEESLPRPATPWAWNFKYYGVVHLPVAGREAFLRSNSQVFELWEVTPGGWQITPRPAGLPVHHLVELFWLALGLVAAVVMAGLLTAARRRQALSLRREKLRPRDVFAPIFLRISAYLVDLLCLAVVTDGAAYLLAQESPRWVVVVLDFRLTFVYIALYLVYLTAAEWRYGRTVGKWLMGLCVVTDQGARLPPWSALVRNLTGFFERQLPLVCLAALPAMLLTPRRQRVGDLLARTVVVDGAAMERFRKEHAAEGAGSASTSGRDEGPSSARSAGFQPAADAGKMPALHPADADGQPGRGEASGAPP